MTDSPSRRPGRALCVLSLLLLLTVQSASSYSVLTHEAIIDSMWDRGIKPLLLKRFPGSTDDDILKAHAYTYGGSIIQDMGYYPFGSKLYSDLTHYVRSGDFIVNMIKESQDLDEYAFALGALAHYAADNNGHRMATNVSVPMLYPKLAAKFGHTVTYADDQPSHLKTEFAFDVVQAAQSRYAPEAYKDFIGFEVSKPLLERAFVGTYGIHIEQIFLSLDLALGSYRHAVGSVLPAMTKVAWQIRGQQIQKEVPGITRRQFLYNLSRSSYEKEWGSKYQKPGIMSRILAFIFRIVPKIGPLKALAFRPVTPATEKLYMASFNSTIDRYRELLAAAGSGSLTLTNSNFDVGAVTKAGQYRLADNAYAKLMDLLNGHYGEISPDLRAQLLDYYQDLSRPIATKANKKDWAKLQEELDSLKATQSLPIPTEIPK